MKVAAYPADLGGCGHYRLIWPARALAAQGADVDVVMPDDPDRDIKALWHDGESGAEVIDVLAPDADVVVLQRPMRDVLADAIPILQAKGVRVVVEIDDDFEAISRRNVSFAGCHPDLHPERNWRHLARACELADLVTVSTPALARRYGAHGRVVVLANYVPARYADHVGANLDDDRTAPIVGWSGSIDTHPDDLQVTGGGVARAVRSTGATFAVVGTGKGVRRALELDAAPVAPGWVPIEDYPAAMAQLDVGIVPLEPSAFNEAKSWLKGAEFAAVGVPFVASPTAPYVALAAGAGVLARTPRDWERAVRRLVLDVDWWAMVRERGLAWAEANTIERHAERWLDAWRLALNTRCAA